MSKPYQHHDEFHDIGKAEPKAKAANPKHSGQAKWRIIQQTTHGPVGELKSLSNTQRRLGDRFALAS